MKSLISTCINSISIKTSLILFLTIIFGKYWFLFIGYMLFNILDWITGSLKAIKLKEISSNIGIRGLLKKIGYWVVIAISFSIPYMFVTLGSEILNINLSFMYLIAWFTLTSLIINEIVSILENLVLLNVKVPRFLIRSLKVTEKALENASNKLLDENKD